MISFTKRILFSFSNSYNALSPLDGRYFKATSDLNRYFSEAALMKYRIKVQAQWLIHLLQNKIIAQNDQIVLGQFKQKIRNLYHNFNDTSAQRIKKIQQTTNHDLKSVEYFIKENINQHKQDVHFCCTSQDINNLAYSLMLKDSIKYCLVPKVQMITKNLIEKSQKWSSHHMLSRTHGQPATPTTLGKQLANFTYRISKQLINIQRVQITGKFNGAVGNYNSHYFSFPQVNWKQLCKQFVQKKLNLSFNPYTTQIQSHDSLVRAFCQIGHSNIIMIGMCRDIWEYISKGYLTQKTKEGEVGSSTMPHKVNPIDFQNCQGNLGVANSMIDHFRNKLPISRLQRDLSDSTVLRNQGSALGYSLIGYSSLLKGLDKIESNQNYMRQQLQNHYEIVTQAIQTQLRKINYPQPYELLKKLSRGKPFTAQSKEQLIRQLSAKLGQNSQSIKKMRNLNPLNYGGQAQNLARQVKNEIESLKTKNK